MRAILIIDETLPSRAHHLSGIKERSALISESLKALIARESARRLAKLGGPEQKLGVAPRRQIKAR